MRESDAVSPADKDLISLRIGSDQFFISEDVDAIVVQPVGSDPEESPSNLLSIERGQTMDDALQSDQASAGFIAVWEGLSDNERAEVLNFWRQAKRRAWLIRQTGSLLAEVLLLALFLEAYALYRHGWAAWTNWVEFVFVGLWVPAIAALSQLIARVLSWLVERLFRWLMRVPANIGSRLNLVTGILLGLSFSEITRRVAISRELSQALALMTAFHNIVIIALTLVVIKVFHGAWHYVRLLILERISKR